jgi:hypothetical protein
MATKWASGCWAKVGVRKLLEHYVWRTLFPACVFSGRSFGPATGPGKTKIVAKAFFG